VGNGEEVGSLSLSLSLSLPLHLRARLAEARGQAHLGRGGLGGRREIAGVSGRAAR